MFQPIDVRQHSKLLLVVALGIFLIGAVGAFFKPKYDWDMMAYIGMIQERSYSTPEEIRAATYGIVRKAVPPQVFEELKYQNERRKIAYEDPVSFVETLSFYRVRVAYWGLGYLLTKTGIHDVVAFRIIGSFFYFATCVTVLLHLVHLFPNRFVVLVLSVLVALYPPLLHLSRVIVPDMMAIFGLVLGISFLLREKLIAGALVLMMTVFVRTDLGVLCVLLIVPVLLVGAGPITKRVSAVMLLILSIPIVLWLNSSFDHPGWAKLFNSWFVETLFYPVSTEEVSVNPRDYIGTLLVGVTELFQRISLWVATVLSVLILYEVYKKGTFREPILVWFGAIIAYLPARLVLWPEILERYVTFYPIVLFFILACLYRIDLDKKEKNLAS